MKNHQQIISLCAGALLLGSTFYTAGCASDGSNTERGAAGGALAGAIIGGIIGHQSGVLGQRPLGWPPG